MVYLMSTFAASYAYGEIKRTLGTNFKLATGSHFTGIFCQWFFCHMGSQTSNTFFWLKS